MIGVSGAEIYRVRQLQDWFFQRRIKSFDEITVWPAALRRACAEKLTLRSLVPDGQVASAEDGTVRFTYKTRDGLLFPSVFLHPPQGGDPVDPDEDEVPGGRSSLCLSTQVGCAWGCSFCASGRVPFKRDLTQTEIVEQIFWAEELTGRRLQSILFMGMGEPLANYENVVRALQWIRGSEGLHYGLRHVTVSTTGLVPQIQQLSKGAPAVNLAISLHAADDETRKKIMPRSARWTIKEVLKAAWDYQVKTRGSRLTFEYVMLDGINDSQRNAQRLSNFLRHRKCWVNLIVYNPVPGLPFQPSTEEKVKKFSDILSERGIWTRVRRPLGKDIGAGCGQLSV